MFPPVLRNYLLFLIPLVHCGLTSSLQVSDNRARVVDAISTGNAEDVKLFPITPVEISVWKKWIEAANAPQIQRLKELDLESKANEECGIANSYQTAQSSNGIKITGGEETLPHQYPWQVLITSRTTSFVCGGSIIANRWIVTAAHCVDDVQEVVILMGAHNWTAFKQPPGQIQISQDILIHPNWNSTSVANDIALIKLPWNITFSNYVRPICLPSDVDTSSNAKDRVTLTGWGRFSDGSNDGSDVLRTVNATVITNEECAKTFAKLITSKIICVVGGGNKGVCNGDSGGPMNYYDQTTGRWTLIGLVSFGSRLGCEKGYPNAFTRVRSYRSWIDGTTLGNNSSGVKLTVPIFLFSFFSRFVNLSYL